MSDYVELKVSSDSNSGVDDLDLDRGKFEGFKRETTGKGILQLLKDLLVLPFPVGRAEKTHFILPNQEFD